MKKPNFFIIGFPKCSTTTIAKKLSYHPEILMPKSPEKFEPEFFCDDINENKQLINVDDYLRYWDDDFTKYKAVGEKSIKYILSKNAIDNILNFNENAKFIISIRNPVDLCLSLHSHMLRIGIEKHKNFEKAWMEQESRVKLYKNQKKYSDKFFLQYANIAKIGEKIECLLKKVDHSKVFFVFFDDIKNNEQKVFYEIFDFLNVSDYQISDANKYNQNSVPRSKVVLSLLNYIVKLKKSFNINSNFHVLNFLFNLNTIKSERLNIDDDLRNKLKLFFKKDIVLIESLTKKNLSDWYQ